MVMDIFKIEKLFLKNVYNNQINICIIERPLNLISIFKSSNPSPYTIYSLKEKKNEAP